ncbi:MAG: ATP-binding cassette domain-containing protein [Gammaproteobacteria bacterium]|nr:ATP-binding cassette domain-containing protein [Gammaproteobacteria bacterium]
MNKEILISVDHVSRYYGNDCAVNDISFSVHRGEVLGFLGPNGAGKSSTMQMICGVLSASTGQITVAGHDMIESPKAAKMHIGFLPERPPLYQDLTVDEYLCYAGRLRGIGKIELKEAIAYSKQRCGLTDTGKRLIKNISKGFQQRVGIAQAIIHSPAVVILDEPTSGLDPNQILEIRELISELGNDHSVILSTHILPEVQSVCDRVLIINQGKLVLDESLDNLQQDDQITPIKIAFRQPPPLDILAEIEGVMDIEQIGNHHFKIYCESEINTINRITNLAAASEWQLYEMIPEQDSLEETFIQLTRGESQPLADEMSGEAGEGSV